MRRNNAVRRDPARRGYGYSNDPADREEARPVDRPRRVGLQDVMDAILHIALAGCPWRMPPQDPPLLSTMRRRFQKWRDRGVRCARSAVIWRWPRTHSRVSEGPADWLN